MKNKNIAIAIGSVLALIAAVRTTSPVFALSDSERHLVGFRDGAHQAIADYGVTSPNPSCPTRDDGSDHTPSYCDGVYKWLSYAVDSNMEISSSTAAEHRPTQQHKD
jgi:hypothetical protein